MNSLAPPSAPPPPITAPHFDVDTQITRLNAERAELFLRERGWKFDGRTQPDEMDPYYEMYVAVMAHRGSVEARNSPNETIRRTTIAGKPGPLVSTPVIEFHSVNGGQMYEGRKPDAEHAFIPGFFACAGALSKAVILSNRGNPWADFHLLMSYSLMVLAEKELMKDMGQLDDRRKSRAGAVGRDLVWDRPEQIITPTDTLYVSTQYANRLLDVLVLADRLTIRWRQAQHLNIVEEKAAMYENIQGIRKRWRSLAYTVWSGTRQLLERPELLNLTRENSENKLPEQYLALAQQQWKLTSPAMPEAVWTSKRLPPHKTP